MKLGTIFTLNEYDEAYKFVEENGYTIEEIEPKGEERQFKIVEIPIYEPTNEEIKQQRIAYRQANIDNQTNERTRRLANGTWTEQDEQEYLELDAQVTAWIEENLPYPEEEENAA